MSRRLESGAFLIVSIMLIVVVAIMTVTLGYFSTSSGGANTLHTASGRAFFAALAGLDVGTGLLAGPGESRRLDCTDGLSTSLEGNGFVTKAYIGATGVSGAFTVTTDTGSLDYHPTTPAFITPSLSAITTSTVIGVNTVTGYATAGLVMIDRERIDYTGTSTSSSTCGGSPACFVGVTRGAGGTAVASHSSSTPVGQLQCRITSTGGYPNLTVAPTAQRVVAQATQMEEAWAVGAAGAGAATQPWFVRYSDNAWADFNYTGSTRNSQLNAVNMISYADGYAVGAVSGTHFTILRWTGRSWFALPAASLPPAANVPLNSVFCVTAGDCHAVGNTSVSPAGEVFLRLTSVGGSWTKLAPIAAIPQTNFTSVYCVSTNFCWAVGNASGGAEQFAWFNASAGAAWNRQATSAAVPNVNFLEVRCWDVNLCWAVGAVSGGNGTFAKWVGGALGTANWQFNAADQPSPAVNTQVNSVTCTSSSDCWAVGNAVGGNAAIFRWLGGASRWTPVTLSPAVNANLNTIRCTSTISCWAVGNAVGGTVKFILRWDGKSWTRILGVAGGAVGDRNLLSVFPIAAASDRAAAFRREVFP